MQVSYDFDCKCINNLLLCILSCFLCIVLTCFLCIRMTCHHYFISTVMESPKTAVQYFYCTKQISEIKQLPWLWTF